MEIYIREAETRHVIPAIRAKLDKEVDENPNAHTLLLDGGYYSNNTRYMAGLKVAICLLTYARFALNNQVNATPFGIKEKLSLDSSTVTNKTLYRHANEAENTGLVYLRQCLSYLAFTGGSCTKPARPFGDRRSGR